MSHSHKKVHVLSFLINLNFLKIKNNKTGPCGPDVLFHVPSVNHWITQLQEFGMKVIAQ